MRLIKKRIPVICLAACMVLAAVLCAYPRVWAAERVDLTQTGKLILGLTKEGSAQMVQDLAQMQEPIEVHAWKLADMLETGRYDVAKEFSGLSLEGEMTEESWKELTEDVMARIYKKDEEGKPVGDPLIEPSRTGSIRVTEEGKVTETSEFDDMELGLYLVWAPNVRGAKYEYSFNPMIISLPWSESQYIGTGASGEASDEWKYSREADMKPARTRLYGKVKIVKTLSSFNAAQGDVTFVFDVIARDGEDIVYSNVVSASFGYAGTQEMILEHIPAGAIVTVTEVYSGANCSVTASDAEPKAVLADNEDGNIDPVTFRFVNEYDGEAKRGYGVENQFRYNAETGEYDWTTDRLDVLNNAANGGNNNQDKE